MIYAISTALPARLPARLVSAATTASFVAMAAILMSAILMAPVAMANHEMGHVMGTAEVIDGDTLKIGSVRIRLFGIDAPEGKQHCGEDANCGQAATDALKQLVEQRLTVCFEEDTDRYGRMVARCYVEDIDLSEWMVRQGHAMAYRYYSADYIAAEEDARIEQRGIWQTDMVAPWEWRRNTGR